MENLKTQLLYYRTTKDLTQQEMAKLIGVSYRGYQEIERTGEVKKLEVMNAIDNLLSSGGTQKIAFPRETAGNQKKSTRTAKTESADKDILKVIAESLQQQKEIDLVRERNREKEIETRNKEADNVTRLIALLEQQQMTGIANAVEEVSLLKKNDQLHFDHHSSLREFVLQLAAEVRPKTDYISQKKALGKLEAVALERGAGKGMLRTENAGTQDSRKKMAKDGQS